MPKKDSSTATAVPTTTKKETLNKWISANIGGHITRKYEYDRFCKCGKKLSMYNPSNLCYVCGHTKTMKDVLSVTGRRSIRTSNGYISKKIGK